ncbi:hypothetical protein L596_030459 [Steinernema carpocapsae]|uniref:Peptidase S1 domain-containing protein n=1 Tax=Steinernema carpocapsae TaxID=34508 RepID=A0A4U5LPH6_STECR|nr:hypothetical protein L596_030459 [Steinernema carpocapsae]
MRSLCVFLALLGLSLASPLGASIQGHHELGDDVYQAQPSELIFGGVHSQLGQWPSQVFIHYMKNTTGKKYACGGTLLTPIYVLTAAHCTEDLISPSVAMTALTDITTAYKTPGVQIREIVSYVRHPDFDPDNTFLNDIAVLTLNASTLLNSTHATIIGYGVNLVIGNKPYPNRFLNYVDLPLKDHDWCVAQWKKESSDKVHIHPNQICYGADGKGSGIGDSGGSIQVLANGKWNQIGVISFGVGQPERMTQQNKYPSVGTRIAPSCRFIEEATEGAYKCLNDL